MEKLQTRHGDGHLTEAFRRERLRLSADSWENEAMSTGAATRSRRVSAAMRDDDRVTPLELFFDLVFVLALTQCTALMFRMHDVEGLLEGILVLGVLWWSWVGYAWLTSVVDPEEGAVRIVMFGAMAAFLVAALSVPGAFAKDALLFACAYAAVRAAHIVLFLLASREDVALRRSVVGLAVSTLLAVGVLVGAAFTGGAAQLGLWGLALLLDAGGPFLFGADGWRLAPEHFAERHGLVVIIALGESIVAIGVGAKSGVGVGVVLAAVLGVVVVAALWWVYFDVTAIVAGRRLASAAAGRERNEIARDSYSYLHFPMVAGVALVALGLKFTIADVGRALKPAASGAMLGGAALYLLAQVAFRLRNMHTLSTRRLLCAALLLALIPLGTVLPSLMTLGILAFVLSTLIAYEALRYAEARERVRHRDPSD